MARMLPVVAALAVTCAPAAQEALSAAPSGASPASASKPLPDVRELLKSVTENQRKLEALAQDYICIKTEEDRQLDSEGRTKNTESRQYEIFFVGWQEVTRLLARDGTPLDAREQKREQERFEKRLREARQRQAAPPDERRGVRLTLSMFLRLSRFQNPRRENFRGADVVAFDFEPQPGAKPRSKAEEVVTKLAGTVWIDDAARQIVRLEGHLLDSVRLGGILATLHQGAAVELEQQRVNEEIWLPSYRRVNFGARILFRGRNVDRRTHYTDYRKFRVDSVVRPAES
jgi:hypothetical protein